MSVHFKLFTSHNSPLACFCLSRCRLLPPGASVVPGWTRLWSSSCLLGENHRKLVSVALRPDITLPWVLSAPLGLWLLLLLEGFCEERQEGGDFMRWFPGGCLCWTCEAEVRRLLPSITWHIWACSRVMFDFHLILYETFWGYSLLIFTYHPHAYT